MTMSPFIPKSVASPTLRAYLEVNAKSLLCPRNRNKIRLPAPLLRREQRAEGGAPCKEIKENQTGMLRMLSYKRHKDCCLIGLR